jgi:hypothetical protein
VISYEEALERWARKNHPSLTDRDITNISVRHNESWTDDDSGTNWEAETIVTAKTRKVGPKGQKHYKTFEVYASGGDPLAFAQELFKVAAEAESERAE